MSNISSLRHASIFNPDSMENKDTNHIIVGVGALGSFLAEALIRLGITDLHLIDYDHVEAHNVANQNFTNKQVGEHKAHTLAKYLNDKFDTDIIKSSDLKLDKDSDLPIGVGKNVIVHMCVDSVEARLIVLELAMEYTAVTMVTDSRMSIDRVIAVAFDPRSEALCKTFEKSLPPEDAYVEVATCGSALSVISNVMASVGLTVGLMIENLKDVEDGDFSVTHHFRGNTGLCVTREDALAQALDDHKPDAY